MTDEAKIRAELEPVYGVEVLNILMESEIVKATLMKLIEEGWEFKLRENPQPGSSEKSMVGLTLHDTKTIYVQTFNLNYEPRYLAETLVHEFGHAEYDKTVPSPCDFDSKDDYVIEHLKNALDQEAYAFAYNMFVCYEFHHKTGLLFDNAGMNTQTNEALEANEKINSITAEYISNNTSHNVQALADELYPFVRDYPMIVKGQVVFISENYEMLAKNSYDKYLDKCAIDEVSDTPEKCILHHAEKSINPFDY